VLIQFLASEVRTLNERLLEALSVPGAAILLTESASAVVLQSRAFNLPESAASK